MGIITAIIECTENNYSAYLEGLDGIVSIGDSIDEIKRNLCEALDYYLEDFVGHEADIPQVLKGGYQLEFKMDVKSFLNVYCGIFTKSALERLTGIHQKQLWHYAKGKSVPRQTQVTKIETALHNLGKELLAIRL